jgi:phosphatidylglycerophosphate synthase
MFDGVLRRGLDPAIDRVAAWLVRRGVGATEVTLVGLAAGLLAAAAIATSLSVWLALVLIAASRIADGLDGAIARRTRPTPLGAFLDIACDFIFYGAIPFAFALADPALNALPAAFLLFAFYANGASFLAFAAIAAGQGLETKARGAKGLYYTTGLAEGSETIGCFVAMVLFPAWFPEIAWAFGALCLVTAAARLLLGWRVFGAS